MSKLSDYTSLIIRGLANTDKVVEGLFNQVKNECGLLSEEEQKEIARRRVICHGCPLFSLNAKQDDKEYQELFKTPFEFDQVRNEYCGSCGCPYKTRTASLSSNCGLEYYNNLNENNKQPLLWEKFDKK